MQFFSHFSISNFLRKNLVEILGPMVPPWLFSPGMSLMENARLKYLLGFVQNETADSECLVKKN
jgi:hypothetical protein